VIERTRHVKRIKGLLATQGVFGFEPMRKAIEGKWSSCAVGMARGCHHG
jgi:hypothetical protein